MCTNIQQEEIWRDIEGYPNYQVSNMGNVKSLNYRKTGKERILKPGKNNGYFVVVLCKDGKVKKNFKVHRLVALAFLGKPDDERFVIDHINTVRTDNRLENLRLCSTQKENCNNPLSIQHYSEANTNGKLSKKVAQYDLQGNLIAVYPSTREIQRQLGFCYVNIINCCNGKRKTCGGFIWRYI